MPNSPTWTFFFFRQHNGENIIPHKVTRREIYYIERENDFPFSLEHHSSLFCTHPVVLFRNTWRARLTENINLRSATHLYSAHRHPLFIFNTWCLHRHNRRLTLIPIKLMFWFFLRFVFLLKTKLLGEASKLQGQKQFLCRIIIKKTTNKKERWDNGWQVTDVKDSALSMSGASFCLISYFYSPLAIIVPLLLEALSPVCLFVSVRLYRLCRREWTRAFVRICARLSDRIWSKKCCVIAHWEQITPKQHCRRLELQRGGRAGGEWGREKGRKRENDCMKWKGTNPCSTPRLAAPYRFLPLMVNTFFDPLEMLIERCCWCFSAEEMTCSYRVDTVRVNTT